MAGIQRQCVKFLQVRTRLKMLLKMTIRCCGANTDTDVTASEMNIWRALQLYVHFVVYKMLLSKGERHVAI